MTGQLIIRDVDAKDLELLRAAAHDQGKSLNGYVVDVLHEQARREHHRRVFASIAAQDRDVPPFGSVAEVRAMRDEKDAQDDESASGEPV